MSRYLATRNMSSKSMHAFLSILLDKQVDRQTTREKTITSFFVGGKNWPTQDDGHVQFCIDWPMFVIDKAVNSE